MEPVVLTIRVIPNASQTRCEARADDGLYKICLQARPEKGKANKALIHFLAKQLGLGRSHIEMISGETMRLKRLRIHGLSEADIERRLLSG